jgi:hypothetical protein
MPENQGHSPVYDAGQETDRGVVNAPTRVCAGRFTQMKLNVVSLHVQCRGVSLEPDFASSCAYLSGAPDCPRFQLAQSDIHPIVT